jgi:hypothetical protein
MVTSIEARCQGPGVIRWHSAQTSAAPGGGDPIQAGPLARLDDPLADQDFEGAGGRRQRHVVPLGHLADAGELAVRRPLSGGDLGLQLLGNDEVLRTACGGHRLSNSPGEV